MSELTYARLVKLRNLTRCLTRRQRARGLRKGENYTKNYIKPTPPQASLAHSSRKQRPIIKGKTTKQHYIPILQKGHTQVQRNQGPLLPNIRPSYTLNQRHERPRFQNYNSFQNNPWSTLSNFGIRQLCILLQDPRMFNLGFLCTNHVGPIKQWGPKF